MLPALSSMRTLLACMILAVFPGLVTLGDENERTPVSTVGSQQGHDVGRSITGRVTGHVRDALTDKSISGARIDLNGADRRVGECPEGETTIESTSVFENLPDSVSVYAGPAGSFCFHSPSRDPIWIRVVADGHAPKVIEVLPGDDPIDIWLDRGATIAGVLLRNEDMSPVSGTVRLYRKLKIAWSWDIRDHFGRTKDGTRPSVLVANAGDDGSFTFSGLGTGNYTLVGETETGKTDPQRLAIENVDRTLQVEVLAKRAASIQVTVSGLPEGERVGLAVLSHETGTRVDGVIDAKNGTTVIPRIFPGHYLIDAKTRGGRKISRSIVVEKDDVYVTFSFVGDFRLFGSVTAGEMKMGAIEVTVVQADRDDEVAGADWTSIEGDYEISGLPAGDYDLLLHGYRFRAEIVDGDLEININLQANRVIGVASLAGVPQRATWVFATLLDDTPYNGVRKEFAAPTDDEGKYEFKGLPNGVYQILVPDARLEGNRGEVVLNGSEQRYDFYMSSTDDFRQVEIAGISCASVDVEVHDWLKENRYVFALELDDDGIGKLPASLIGYSLTFALPHVGSRQVQSWDGRPLNLTLEEQPPAN